jgi:exopolyphosphatase/guanosine-5'-triphosphate,3'-diphosphate pyrophosphatase
VTVIPPNEVSAAPPATVAIIDVGSNSIKLLVAERSEDGVLRSRAIRTLEARISAGLSAESPRLGATGMQRGLEAIQLLLQDARAWNPGWTILVATSAVRDAANGGDFARQVAHATGQTLRILSGAEEAALIGRGLLCDPDLAALRNFSVFDLGGGSLECLAFVDRRIRQAISLPLGCVRLTERFVPDSALPLAPSAEAAIRSHVAKALTGSDFRFDPATAATAVGTGGTFTTVRAIRGAAAGLSLEETAPEIAVAELRALADRLGRMPLAERQSVPGLPRKRADVFPAALITLLALAERGGIASFHHSLYNLRWGLAAEALAA